jgi:hypothetical protein
MLNMSILEVELAFIIEKKKLLAILKDFLIRLELLEICISKIREEIFRYGLNLEDFLLLIAQFCSAV